MLAVLLVVLGAGIALMILLFGNKDVKLKYAQIDISSGMSYRVKDGTVSYIAEDYITSYNVNDGKEKTLQLQSQIDGYAMRDSKFVVFADGEVHIEDMASSITLTGVVRDVRMGKDYIAVLRTNTQGSDSIVIFDYAGNTAGEVLDFSGSKVTGFGFYTEHGRELLWIISVAVDQNTPVTTVKMFDYGQGGITSYLSPFYDQSVENLFFTENSIFVIGTQDIVRYAIEGGKEKYRIPIYGNKVLDMVSDEEMATFLLAPRNAATWNSVRVVRATETDEVVPIIRRYSVSEPILGAFLQESGIRFVTQQHMYIFGYSGRLLNTLELEYTPIQVYKFDDSNLLLVSENALYRMYAK